MTSTRISTCAILLLAVILSGLTTTRYRLVSGTDHHDAVRHASTYMHRLAAKHRPFRPRLCCGYGYTPIDASTLPPTDLMANEARSLQGLLKHGSAETLRLLAQYRLLTAELDGDIRRIIETLESARTSADAALLCDLSAAYFTLAERKVQPFYFLHALEAAIDALFLEPDFPEALFNRALALEALGLRHDALVAWQDYSRLDPHSGWADEARQRQQKLGEESIADWSRERPRIEEAALEGDHRFLRTALTRHYSRARHYVEDELLASWAESYNQGDRRVAERALAEAREIAEVLADQTGDMLATDAVDAIETSLAQPANQSRLEALVEGHQLYRRGIESFREKDLKSACRWLEGARRELQRGRSMFSLRAAYQLAICFHEEQPYTRLLEHLGELKNQLDPARHLNLLGEVLWAKGRTYSNKGHLQIAGEDYRAALRLFIASGDIDNMVGVQNLLSDNLEQFGDITSAWQERLQALSLMDRVSRPLRRYKFYSHTARSAWRHGFTQAALVFQQQALVSAEDTADPRAISDTWLWLGRFQYRLRQIENARASLWQAQQHISGLESIRRRAAEIELMLAESEIWAERDPQSVITALTDALDHYKTTDVRFHLASILEARARHHVAAGDDVSARHDLARVVEIYEEDRSRILDPKGRVSLFERAGEVFEMIIALEMRLGNTEQAFGYLERRRARELLDEVAGLGLELSGDPTGARHDTTRPYDLDSLRRQLPDDTAVLAYAVVGDQMLVWRLYQGDLVGTVVSDSMDDLEDRVQRFRRQLIHGAPVRERITSADELFRDLVAPLLVNLTLATALVLVPDGVLHELPFAALFDSRKERYLIETHSITVAPSASLYVQGLERDLGRAVERRPSALLLGNPAINGSTPEYFHALPGAEQEVRRAAKFYEHSHLLTGAAATQEHLLEVVGSYDIAHFGAHAIVNPYVPGMSALMLTPSAGSPRGALYAHELYGRRLDQTRLVVLAACATAIGARRQHDGISSLARPFLAAGVTGVVASLWEVDDRATVDLMIRLHRRLSEGESARQALRLSQIELITADRSLGAGSWAAFQMIGEAFSER